MYFRALKYNNMEHNYPPQVPFPARICAQFRKYARSVLPRLEVDADAVLCDLPVYLSEQRT